jgi:hypothetical protein
MARAAHSARRLALPWLAACSILLTACGDSSNPTGSGLTPDKTSSLHGLAPSAVLTPRPVLTTLSGVTVYSWGFGSALAPDPNTAGYFYSLTDRGPNTALGSAL